MAEGVQGGGRVRNEGRHGRSWADVRKGCLLVRAGEVE